MVISIVKNVGTINKERKNKPMKTLEDLISHMKKYKDTIVIVGNKVNSFNYDFTSDEFNNNFNRKSLKRNPKKLWDFFYNKLYTDIDNNNIYEMLDKIDYNLLINQNINGPINSNTINLHGNINKFLCPKCNTIYSSISFNKDDNNIPTCELCGKPLRPSILLANERYNQEDLNTIDEELIKTHTLFCIGLDYTEQAILDLIADYGDVKSVNNSDPKEKENNGEKVLVIIQDKDIDYDPNQITFCEFLVKDNLEDALKRFIDKY